MELITRKIRKVREGREMFYEFQTYSEIFKQENDLQKYLSKAFINGIDMNTPVSASTHEQLLIKFKNVKSDLIDLAKNSNYEGNGNKQHSILQTHTLKYDPCTIACEVPVRRDDLSCFIDIIRIKDGFIEVCDFKPKAHKETHAATQVYLNMKLLSEEAKIPFGKLKGFYFDSQNCYQLIF